MFKNFRAYQLAVTFYKNCENLRGPKHLQEQLLRSSSSIALNLAEGSERVTDRDRRRFYRISMASLRESQAVLDLLSSTKATDEAKLLAEQLGGYVFKLCQSLDIKLKTTGTEGRELRPGPKKTD